MARRRTVLDRAAARTRGGRAHGRASRAAGRHEHGTPAPRRVAKRPRWPLLAAGLLVAVVLAAAGVAFAQEAASTAEAGAASGAPLAAAIATGLAAIGAGIAVGIAGAAAIGAIAEKPELLGRTLIFVGLAEGIVIYGLIISFIILGGG
jgi:V/A-type H+/Na+-transporting ATPase subunit K